MIPACLASRDLKAILENWGLGDPSERRVPRDKKAPGGHLERLETLALLELQACLVPAAPQEARAHLASEAPLEKMGSTVRREQQVKKGVQDQLVPEVILVLPGSQGYPDREKMESRGFVGHPDYLDL